MQEQKKNLRRCANICSRKQIYDGNAIKEKQKKRLQIKIIRNYNDNRSEE